MVVPGRPSLLRTRALGVFGSALGCLLSASCQGADDRGSAQAGRVLSLHAHEDWAVGGLGELGGVVFEAEPASAAIGPGGRVVVADRLGAKVLLIGGGGQLLGSWGRRGAGPGEFQAPVQVGFTPDSLFWVADSGLERISWLDLAGGVAETRSFPREPVPSSTWMARGRWVLNGGHVLGAPTESSGDQREAPRPLPLVVWDRERTLHVVGWVERRAPQGLRIPLASGFFSTSEQPLPGFPILGASPGGHWFFALQRDGALDRQGRGEIVITRYAPSGTELQRVGIAYQGQALDEETLGRLRRRAAFQAERIASRWGPIQGEEIFNAYWIPSHLPPVREALADEEGFWLQREVVRPGRWERYDLGGELCAVVMLPPGFRGLAATADRMVGIRTDSLGVHTLQAYRLER